MKTLAQFVEYGYFSSRNSHFDRTLYSLTAELDRICTVLRDAEVPFELVGGVAVLAHILDRDRSRSFVTRNIDLLVHRNDLDRLVKAGEAAGYEGRKIVGGFMLIRPDQAPVEAVHVIFAGERSKSTQPAPHPEVTPVWMPFVETSVPVAPLADLLKMKLNSLRAKDMAHIETLDEAGLITASIESELPHLLLEHLQRSREQFLVEKPDVEN